MPVDKKTFSKIQNLELSLDDSNNTLKHDSFNTIQGLPLISYNVYKKFNDIKVKNYTNNILTERKEINEIMSFKSDNEYKNKDLSSKIAFSGSTAASATNFLSFEPNFTISDSIIKFADINDDNNAFIIDFINDETCLIKTTDSIHTKHLVLDGTNSLQDRYTPNYKFSKIDTSTEYLSNYTFNYNLDNTNNFLNLFATISGRFFIIAPFGGTLSACNPNSNVSIRSIIKLDSNVKKANTNNFSNYNFYDYKNNYNISNDSLTGEKFNFLSYFPYETTTLSANDGKFRNNLKFFNLKNQISNLNNVNAPLPLENKTMERNYTNLLNLNTTEKNNENILLGYNFYTKEYSLKADKNTRLTLPDSLFPFQKINIQDTNLYENGAYPAYSPYFSDKIFKLQDDNKNVNSNVPDINQLFLLDDVNGNSFIILEDGSGLFNRKEEYGLFDYNDNSGTFLCSWLSGNETTGRWYDRYYFPVKNGLVSSLSGTTEQVFTEKNDALLYFQNNGITDIFFDIESNMLFQPKSTYFYSRIGNEYINKIINNQSSKELKNSFNLQLSGNTLPNEKTLKLQDKNFDNFNFDLLREDNFNISFDLDQDSLSSIDSYQIMGNIYDNGISLKNNFYFTPFAIIPDGNRINFYDNDFNLIKSNIYSSLSSIDHIYFLEQNNNFVIVGSKAATPGKTALKSSFFGEVSDENNSTAILTDIGNIAGEINDSIVVGYNKAIILKNVDGLDGTANNFHQFDLGTLNLSSTNHNSFSGASGYPNSIIETPNGVKPLIGYKGKRLNDSIGVSIYPTGIGNSNYVLFESLTGSQLSTDFDNLLSSNSFHSNPLSTNKQITDINVYNEKLYIQSFINNTGTIQVFDTQREFLSSFNLSTSANQGYKLDFMNDDNGVNLLSFAKDSNGKILVDKISLTTGSISSYNLNLSSNNVSIYNRSLGFNPVNFNDVYNKYSEKQGKMHFKFNVNNFVTPNFISVFWDNAGVAGGFDQFTYNFPGVGLSAWDGTFEDATISRFDTNFEAFLPVKELKLKNTFSVNFNLKAGKVEFYQNGEFLGLIRFVSNFFPTEAIKSNNIFFNNQNIKNIPISKLLNTNKFYGKGGSLSNVKVYNNSVSEDFVRYLFLKDKTIDDLTFDIPCGSRNNVEEINSLYNYNIPGSKNNNLKIYIKNGRFNDNTKELIKTFVNSKVEKVLPINVNNLEYNFDLN